MAELFATLEKTVDKGCCGLFGKIFGHRYVEAVNTEESGLVAEQLTQIVEAIKADESSDCGTIRQLIAATPTRTAIVKAIYCDRCGDDRKMNGAGTPSH